MNRIFVLFILFAFSVLGYSQLKLASVFTDNAVLQQGINLPIWGETTPGAKVEVGFAGSVSWTHADSTGKWMVRLPMMSANSTPQLLTVISGKERIYLKNILVGEVWLASGQSNMDFRIGWGVKNMDNVVSSANYNDIRFFVTSQTSLSTPSNWVKGNWVLCNPENVKDFSAVAYFFSRNLHIDQKVPVGIIQAALGATSIESWTSLDMLATHPQYRESANRFDTNPENWKKRVELAARKDHDRNIIADTTQTGLRMGIHKLSYNDAKWSKTTYPATIENMGYFGYWGMIWLRKSFEIPAKVAQEDVKLFLPVNAAGDKVYVNGQEIIRSLSGHSDKSVNIQKGILRPGANVLSVNMFIVWGVGGIGDEDTPCYLETVDGKRIDLTKGYWTHNNKIEAELPGFQGYFSDISVNFNGMINPLIPYGIRGFLWYQGESNSLDAQRYLSLQPMLINDWRLRWKQGCLPFLYVQLSNYRPRSEQPMVADDWASFRDVQTQLLYRSQNVGMACTIDIGEANDIHPRNKQDVGYRLYLIAKAKIYDPNNRIEYSGPVLQKIKKQEASLYIYFEHAKGLHSTLGKQVTGFAVSDYSGKFRWTPAWIEDSYVKIDISGIVSPQRVQYAWGNNPEATLYNGSNLPALPFNETITQKN